MFSQYFGNYLQNKGLITPGQLMEALEIQRSVHVKLGILAVNSGYMSASQVQTIHNRQKQIDRKFGELALEAGYITGEQLAKLLAVQQQNHLLLGQALADKRYITSETLQKALESYKTEFALTDRQFNRIQEEDISEMVRVFFHFGETLWSKVYGDYVSLMLRNLIRFIDDNPSAEINRISGDYNASRFVFQEIDGKINMLTGIACDTNTSMELATRFAGMKIPRVDVLVQDWIGEFLTVHNKLFLVNMSSSGMILNMRPQFTPAENMLKGFKKGYCIRFHLSFGDMDLLVL